MLSFVARIRLVWRSFPWFVVVVWTCPANPQFHAVGKGSSCYPEERFQSHDLLRITMRWKGGRLGYLALMWCCSLRCKIGAWLVSCQFNGCGFKGSRSIAGAITMLWSRCWSHWCSRWSENRHSSGEERQDDANKCDTEKFEWSWLRFFLIRSRAHRLLRSTIMT